MLCIYSFLKGKGSLLHMKGSSLITQIINRHWQVFVLFPVIHTSRIFSNSVGMLVSHGGFGWLLADLCCPRTTSHSSNKSHKGHIKGNGGLKRIIDQRTYARPRPLDRNIVINTISFCKLWKCVLFFHSFSLNGSTDKDNNVFAWFSYYSILVQKNLHLFFWMQY